MASTVKEKVVLFISALDCWSMGQGKGGPALYRSLLGYAERGWKVYFITSNKMRDVSDKIHENIYILRFDAPWLKRLAMIRKIGFFARFFWWIYFQCMAFLLAYRLRRKGVTVDVIYGYEVDAAPVAKLLSKLWRVPLVARFQGTSYEAGWQGRKFRGIRAWEHWIGLKIPANIVIMTNDGTQGDKVLRALGVKMTKVRFWLNGVNWDAFHCMPTEDKTRRVLSVNQKHVLVCVSRLVGWKRVDRSICALPEVVKEFPDTMLLIVGDGPERQDLERLAHELGVEGHVRFEGAVAQAEIPKYLAAADIFLSFYDWSNVGNPLLEAMMAGKCVVTLNNGDTGQFVKNGENGILLEYEDLPRLPEVIKTLLKDRDLKMKLGANARKFAEENFWTWQQRIEAEITEVEKLLEERSSAYS